MMQKHLLSLLSLSALLLSPVLLWSCKERETKTFDYPLLLTEEQLLARPDLCAGIYAAYPGTPEEKLTPTPEGYEPFYISHYGRHGSRYQPNDSRYLNTLHRLQSADSLGNLTQYGKSLLPHIQRLCDHACGHGGQLTVLGARQHEEIAWRMYHNFSHVFARDGRVQARSSVVSRCRASMLAFTSSLEACDSTLQITAETDSAFMRYIAYDTPEMRQLSADSAAWRSDYASYALNHLDLGRLMDTLFVDPVGLDSLHAFADLYWLASGMQDLDLPDVDLDGLFTPEEMLAAYRCVNYRMYVCNAACPRSKGIPAASASTLLQNIVSEADAALSSSDSVIASLRFGHDSNILRLMALMRIHNASNQETDSEHFWTAWQECTLSPMAANLQLIFYRPTLISAAETPDYLVKILLNEHEVLLDAPLQPVSAPYYHWTDLRHFWSSCLNNQAGDNVITVNIQ